VTNGEGQACYPKRLISLALGTGLAAREGDGCRLV